MALCGLPDEEIIPHDESQTRRILESFYTRLAMPGRAQEERDLMLANPNFRGWVADKEISFPERRIFQVYTTPVISSTGECVGRLWVGTDVTEQRRNEEAIGFQARLLDAVGEAVIATDLAGKITYWNRAATNLYGWTAKEVAGLDILEVTPSDQMRQRAAEIMDCIRRGESWSGEFLVRQKNGGEFLARVTDFPIYDQMGRLTGVVGVSADITKQIQLQEQFLQSQKIESIGRLAGGVAHDFNNMISVIQGYTQLACMNLPLDHPVMADLEQIQEAANRAASLTHQLLAFSRRQRSDPRLVNINDLVRDTNKMLQRLIGEDIELVVKLDEGLPLVRIDPAQLGQVLINLAVNARDAMPEGGRLTIKTRRATRRDSGAVSLPENDTEEWALLSISDTGMGMSQEVKERLFEPFFTTKEAGKGTGLGLSTCYGIVTQAGGVIQVSSEAGQGANFDVYLPVAADSPAGTATASAPSKGREPLPGGETILLAEDEGELQKMLARVLRQQGYRVLEARNGEEALGVAESYDGPPINLLLTDLVMPRMNGWELARHMRRRYPGIKVLLTSGYTEGRLTPQELQEEAITFLQKPFNRDDLLEKVRQALDSPGRPVAQ